MATRPDYGAPAPIMRTKVRVRDPAFGWGWIGVSLLAIVGISAVMQGGRHEAEHQTRTRK